MERTHRPLPTVRRSQLRPGVSILVVMERTHRRGEDAQRPALQAGVSILVVMERTHRRDPARCAAWQIIRCFNPCCDGTDSSTLRLRICSRDCKGVSILVVMERTHRQPEVSHDGPRPHVSILVVMERTHRPGRQPYPSAGVISFNPCCDGTDSSTIAPPGIA